MSEQFPREPWCLKCRVPLNAFACADAIATSELHQCRAIVTCGMCGAKNQIYSVTEYRVLKLFEPDTKHAEQATPLENK